MKNNRSIAPLLGLTEVSTSGRSSLIEKRAFSRYQPRVLGYFRNGGSIWVTAALVLLASWPSWLWLARRATDGSDEPWGIVALLTLPALIWQDKNKLRRPGNLSLAMISAFSVAANIAWGAIPPIFSAALALMAMACLVIGILPERRPRLPLLFLGLLSLPLTASLNFYLGYPLRWFCAQASAALLIFLGLSVSPQGAALLWNGTSILIDAPCAGIAMLWLGLYLAALFSYLNSASRSRSLINQLGAFIVILLANVARNAALFYKESGILALPEWTHEAIGLLIFGLVVLTVYSFTARPELSDENH